MNLLDISYKRITLDNGLEVLLSKESSLPLTAVNLWYRVGSGYEIKTKTGLAHLFEHMMFQGSEHIPKGMHFKYIQEAGGTLNGSTNFDRTNFYEKVPSNYLEMALWLESDRMGFLLPALDEEKLQNQIDVVKNERLERYENQPYGLAWEKILSALFDEGHPYSWPTIGWMDDILSYSLDDVKSFFRTYYQPANAAMTIVGDVNEKETLRLVEAYFNEIQGSEPLPLKPEPKPQQLTESKILSFNDSVQLDRIYLAWHTTPIFHKDDAPLDIAGDILTGSKSSRLYRNLVFEREVAQNVTAFQFSGMFGGFFCIFATAKPNVPLAELKGEIFRELKKIADEGPSDDELMRSKNTIQSSYIYSLQNIDIIADQMNRYNFFLGEPNSFGYDLDRYRSVTKEDIQRVSDMYFTKHFTELSVRAEVKNAH